VELIVRRPNRNQEEAPRTWLTFRRFASGYDFSIQLGISARFKSEEIRKQFHIYSIFPGKIIGLRRLSHPSVSASLIEKQFAVTTTFERFTTRYVLQMIFDARVSCHLKRREKNFGDRFEFTRGANQKRGWRIFRERLQRPPVGWKRECGKLRFERSERGVSGSAASVQPKPFPQLNNRTRTSPTRLGFAFPFESLIT
jgi:hypothetical protein